VVRKRFGEILGNFEFFWVLWFSGAEVAAAGTEALTSESGNCGGPAAGVLEDEEHDECSWWRGNRRERAVREK
jgi:hypothetical protein